MASHETGEATGDKPVDNQTCSICIEPFTEPKLLPCFHTFCRHCLEQFTDKSAVNGKFSCPVCRFTVTLPASGVKGFQTNFYIEAHQIKSESEGAICEICSQTAVNRCRQCEQAMCEQCTSVHNTLSVTRSHALVRLEKTSKDYPAITKPEFCSKHRGELFRFLCKKCEKPICRDCKLTSHEGHLTLDLEDVIEEGRQQLAKLKVDFDLFVPLFERKLQEATEKKTKFSEIAEKIVSNIDSTADRLIMLINNTRQSKLREIEKVKKSEIDHLDDRIDVLNQEKMFLLSHISHISTLLTEGCGADILNTLPNMTRRLAELSSPASSVDPKLDNPQILKATRTEENRSVSQMELCQILMPVSEPKPSTVNSVFQCSSEIGTVDFICPVRKNQAWIGLYRRTGYVGKCMLGLFSKEGVLVKGFHVSNERYESNRLGGVLSLMHVGDEKEKSDEILALEKDVKLKQRPHSDTRNGKTCNVDVMKRIVTVVNESGEQELELSPLPLSSATNNFSPRDVCWNNSNDLVIVDKGSKSLLLYDNNCATLGSYVIKQNQNFSPSAVAVSHNGKLWVGEDSGRVSVVDCNDVC